MYSPSVQRLLIEAHIDDLHRAAQTFNPARAARASEIRRPKASPRSTYVKRTIKRVFDRAASATSENVAANQVLDIVGPGTAATSSQRS